MPTISIIIPAYNSEKYISEAIDSVLYQAFESWELLIINDGSFDRTAQICDSYITKDNRIKVFHQNNKGLPAARNEGIKRCSIFSEYLLFLDSDDILEKDILTSLKSILDAYPEAPAAHGKMRLIDSQSKPILEYKLNNITTERWGIIENKAYCFSPYHSTSFNTLVIVNNIRTPGQVLIRRNVIDIVGTFDAEFKSAEDWDLWLRISNLADILFINKIVLNYRIHDNNMTLKVKVMSDAVNQIYKKFLNHPSLDKEKKQLLRVGYIWRFWYNSRLYFLWAIESFEKGDYWKSINQFRHGLFEQIKFFNFINSYKIMFMFKERLRSQIVD